MNTQPGRKNTFAAIAILVVMPLLTACGDGEEEETPKNLIDNSASYHQPCTSWTQFYEDPAACTGSGASSSSGGSGTSGGSTGATSSTSGISALVNSEIEQNDTLANANVMSYPSRTGAVTHIGWVAEGSVSDLDDAMDYFSFTAPVSRDYTIRLCPPAGSTCHGTTGIDTLTAFFELLDQDGQVLLSSQATSTNAYEAAIDAGVIYYVRIMAGDTMSATVGYHFQAFENQ